MKTDLSMGADVAATRKQTGADRWDEMWEGELHVPPSPNLFHQRFQFKLVEFLEYEWAKRTAGEVYHEANVAGPGKWTENYRVPDIVLLTPERLDRKRGEYIAGGPDVVIEIMSPDDASRQKLQFYAQIGVREVWIIDRDSKLPEIYAATKDVLGLRSPTINGWYQSEVTGLEMKADGTGKLVIRRLDDPTTEKSLPE